MTIKICQLYQTVTLKTHSSINAYKTFHPNANQKFPMSLNIYHHLSRWHNSANKINELERESCQINSSVRQKILRSLHCRSSEKEIAIQVDACAKKRKQFGAIIKSFHIFFVLLSCFVFQHNFMIFPWTWL